MDYWTDKCTDTHTYTVEVEGCFHQHPINSVWSPLYEQKTLISTSKTAWAETVKESWKDHIAFAVHFALSLMYICLFLHYGLFLSETWLTFPPLMCFISIFRVCLFHSRSSCTCLWCSLTLVKTGVSSVNTVFRLWLLQVHKLFLL